MTTNILATILSLLVTNVTEQIQTDRIDPWVQAYGSIGSLLHPTPKPRKLPDLKHVTTEVYDQRLLILEAEGITFTNVMASVMKLRKTETFVQRIPTPPEPVWELDTNSIHVHFTGEDMRYYFGTNSFTNSIFGVGVSTNTFIKP